jgi:hypothetical protein
VRKAAVIAALALAACGSFEDPTIVLDLRILAMTAEPPEQVVPFDPENPLATEFGPVEVCVLVAEPGIARRLEWSMEVCPPQSGGRRCADTRPSYFMGAGVLEDPETAATPQVACATLPPGPHLVELLRDTIENDSVSGFGGIDLNVLVRVVPEGGVEDQAVYGHKSARYSPQLPAERVANTNPSLFAIEVDRLDGNNATTFPLGRCIDQAAPLTLGPRQSVRFWPIEADGVREDYLVPTFEGGARMFTENLTYQWLAGGGDWTRGSTGGTRDGAGNYPPLDSSWESPSAEDLAGPTDIPIWIIQRDERGGGTWFESCIRVVP